MIVNPQLKQQAKILLSNQKYSELKTWFTYWENQDELIDKVLIWGHIFMREFLRTQSPEFHRDIIGRIFSSNNEYTAAPRGFAKTTVIQLCIAFICANKMKNFIALIEKNYTEATEVLNGVRAVFDQPNGEIVRIVYGSVIGSNKSAKDKDAQGDLYINGVRLRGKGFDTPIRGLKSVAWRPDLVILDDVESDEHINNPEQRRKYMDNYNKGIQPAVDITGSVKVFGTILHFDSLLMNLINWHGGKVYRAYEKENPQTTLLWRERWSFEKLEQKKKEMTTEKGSSAFYQEYLNDPVSDEERTFKQHWIWNKNREIKLTELLATDKIFNGYAALDFADSVREGSDWTGVVVHLVDIHGNRYRVSCRRERRNALGKIDLIFELWSKWHKYGLNEIGVEKKAFESEVRPMLDIEMAKRNIYPIVKELKPMQTSKTTRIRGNLVALYETGRIWTIIDEQGLPIENTEALRNELYDFPASKKDDLSDAEAYITDMVQIPLDTQRSYKSEEDDSPFAIFGENTSENNNNHDTDVSLDPWFN